MEELGGEWEEGAWDEPMRGMRRGQLVYGKKGQDYCRRNEGTGGGDRGRG